MDTVITDMKITYTSIYFLILIMFFGCTEMDKSSQEPLPDVVTHESHVKTILDQSCVRCHGGSETLMDLNLSSYSEIQQLIGTDVSSDIIVPGNSFSKLLRKTRSDGSMYMYLNNFRDYELLYQWIVIDGVAEN